MIHVLYKVRECQRVQWQTCQARNVVVGDSLRVQTLAATSRKWPETTRPTQGARTAQSYDMRLNNQRPLDLCHCHLNVYLSFLGSCVLVTVLRSRSRVHSANRGGQLEPLATVGWKKMPRYGVLKIVLFREEHLSVWAKLSPSLYMRDTSCERCGLDPGSHDAKHPT